MRNHDKDYWEKYYEFWDTQIKDWFKERENNCNSELARSYGQHVRGLVFEDLPEPYYGSPDKGVKAVVLHHNPGISTEGSRRNTGDERQKYFYHIEDDLGWLIRKFRDKCCCSYHKFVENYSCLIPRYRSRTPEVDGQSEKEICGVKWWQGLSKDLVDNEVKWLAQIYGKIPNPDNKPEKADRARLHPLEVFVLEMCPFHSKDFKVNSKFFKTMRSLLMKQVFGPAIRAVRENDLPFAIARGGKFRDLLEAMGLQCEKEWSHADNVIGWPTHENDRVKDGKVVKKKGENINRTYRLYTIKDDAGVSARILLTWYSGAYNPPTDKFKDVEQLIRQYVSDHPITAVAKAVDESRCEILKRHGSQLASADID